MSGFDDDTVEQLRAARRRNAALRTEAGLDASDQYYRSGYEKAGSPEAALKALEAQSERLANRPDAQGRVPGDQYYRLAGTDEQIADLRFLAEYTPPMGSQQRAPEPEPGSEAAFYAQLERDYGGRVRVVDTSDESEPE